jgi:hypothetical protein
MLRRGEAVPHFDITTIAGRRVHYGAIWQRQELVLVAVDRRESDWQQGIRLIGERSADLDRAGAALVVTADPVPGIEPPAVVVADRWGEVQFAAHPAHAAELPGPDELLDWIEHVQQKCPECEGEAR